MHHEDISNPNTGYVGFSRSFWTIFPTLLTLNYRDFYFISVETDVGLQMISPLFSLGTTINY